MLFTIVTPSFRSSRWLKLCIASVADQQVEHEHIVQDSCSDDGTQEWLPKDPRVIAAIEKDTGMYDAVNRGLRKSQGQILAYLNCDEQFLPGALAAVQTWFEQHPHIEVAFADTLVVDEQGDYICHRQSVIPKKHHTLVGSNLGVLTCAIFFRRSILDQHGLFFSERLKAIGDAEWVLRLLEHKISMGLMPVFTSVFTETGANLCLTPNARREMQRDARLRPGLGSLRPPAPENPASPPPLARRPLPQSAAVLIFPLHSPKPRRPRHEASRQPDLPLDHPAALRDLTPAQTVGR